MKINEFKPGNIVYPKDHQGRVIENPIRIIDRYGDQCSFQFYRSSIIPDDNNMIEVYRLFGIPLSKEWMKILGFEEKYQKNWYKEEIRVEFDDNSDFKAVYFVPEENPIPEYKDSFSVSDLQNLYFERYRQSLL